MEDLKNKEKKLGKRNINKLNSEDLDEVSGGFVYRARMHPTDQWEVIDKDTGRVLDRYSTREEAKSRAQREWKQSPERLSWDKLKKIRQGENGINLDK